MTGNQHATAHQTSSDGTSADARTAAYRILDANANRAVEGLRVVEEYLRLGCNDLHLTQLCKQLRHDLVTLLSRIPTEQLQRARDVVGDVGTSVGTAQEYAREDLGAVVAANLRRVLQALRSLEEYAKVVAKQLAPDLESLRYRAYTLERAITTLRRSRRLLGRARLYVLIDGRPSPAAFQTLVAQLLEAGVDVLQLRDKGLTDRELLARAQQLRSLTRHTPTLCIVNDRVDIALAADADGVHLGQDELPVAAARRLLGSDKLIGVSTHDISQARQAVWDGADYLGCGPTFRSATKSFTAFPGLELLRQVSGEIGLPAFAIGGIDEQNVTAVLQAGLSRVAVSQAVLGAADAGQAARRLVQLLRPAAEQGTRAHHDDQ